MRVYILNARTTPCPLPHPPKQAASLYATDKNWEWRREKAEGEKHEGTFKNIPQLPDMGWQVRGGQGQHVGVRQRSVSAGKLGVLAGLRPELGVGVGGEEQRRGKGHQARCVGARAVGQEGTDLCELSGAVEGHGCPGGAPCRGVVAGSLGTTESACQHSTIPGLCSLCEQTLVSSNRLQRF